MLEVTILKGEHGTEEDAQKLLPYIKKCDVYAPECAFLTRGEAEIEEQVFEQLLSLNLNRNKLYELLEQSQTNVHHYYNYPKFGIKEREYLYQERKRLWHVERFLPEEAENGMATHNTGAVILIEAARKFLEGNIEEYLKKFRNHLLLLEQICEQRDIHIAQNLASAEENIRKRYPQLAEKESISLCVALGADHRVEKLYPTAVPIYLLDAPRTAMDRLNAVRTKKIPPDEINSALLLAVGATTLLGFSEAEVEQLGFDELTEKIRKKISEQRGAE